MDFKFDEESDGQQLITRPVTPPSNPHDLSSDEDDDSHDALTAFRRPDDEDVESGDSSVILACSKNLQEPSVLNGVQTGNSDRKFLAQFN